MSRRASGLKAWFLQRATAVYLGLFGVYLALYFMLATPAGHAELVAWVASPWVALGLLLFIPILLAHAWVGIRDVLMDYMKPIALRATAMTLVGFVFLAAGLWAAQAVIAARAFQ
ncbi:succinate dehydrogenase, hydrophobic membrane anchor protein [uncultured Thiohalocapsa sp.]|uniref:succinate dehydrogenase, hydrophobic membrane anchor protein n=1 Tax=uncultured Thiohalocapsa sp. TaxID=768990 RepID=UPI0025F86C17|nr:succinate dehydrogenase, hydrophobic membrane anchor protein [uncultured Thiohalocapsa sp.]